MTAQPADTSTLQGIVAALRSLLIVCERLRDESAEAHQVRGADTRLLSMLCSAGEPLRPVEIADRFGISSGTLTALLDRLEQAGLLARLPHPSDRRSYVIVVTTAGAEVTRDFDERLIGAIAAVTPPEHVRAVEDAVIGATQLLAANLSGWPRRAGA